MANPSIKELHETDKFELIAELKHEDIKHFVIDQITKKGYLVNSFMIYQAIMVVAGIFIVTRSAILAFQNNFTPLYYVLGSLLFSFSLLVFIHEMLHGIAIKLTGAPKVNYGAYLKKFIFYAEADQHVLNRKQFSFIALTPFIVLKFTTLLGIFLFFHHSLVYSFALIMCIHSLFCAGDIGLLSVFYQYSNKEIYTYDSCDEKKSYYFKRK